MIKVLARIGEDKRPLYLFGLTPQNLTLLQRGKPIHIDLAEMGGAGEVVLMFGESEAAIVRELAEFIGPSTVVRGMPDEACQ